MARIPIPRFQRGCGSLPGQGGEGRGAGELSIPHLGEGLDLALLDDRSRLAHRARPLLERIPGQLVKMLMYQRLAELTALPQGALEAAPEQAAPVDAYADGPFPEDPLESEGLLKLRRPEPAAARGRVRRERAERALAFAQAPRSRRCGPEAAGGALGASLRGGTLLAELLTILQQSPGPSASAPLGRYVGTDAHERLLSLASTPLPFEGTALNTEFGELLGHLRVEGETDKRRAPRTDPHGQAQDGDLEAFLALKRAAAGVDPQSS